MFKISYQDKVHKAVVSEGHKGRGSLPKLVWLLGVPQCKQGFLSTGGNLGGL